MRKMSKNAVKDAIGVEGRFRLQITERDLNGKDKIVGDSGWNKNQVTNLGIAQYLLTWLTDGAGGKRVTHMTLGTGTQPASDATALAGENTQASNARKSVTSSTIASRTAQFTAAFASSDSFVTATMNISNVGLFNTSTTSAGTIFAGNTYASSAVATNQNVYFCDWRSVAVMLLSKLREFGEQLFESIPSRALALS